MTGIKKSFRDERGFNRTPEVPGFLVRRSGLVAVIVIIVIAGGALYTQGFRRVPAGYRGVLLTWGKVEERIKNRFGDTEKLLIKMKIFDYGYFFL